MDNKQWGHNGAPARDGAAGRDGADDCAPQGAEAAFRAMVEAMNEGAAILIDGLIVYCNGRLAALLGVPLDQLVGKSLLRFIGPDAHAGLAAILAAARAGASRNEVLFVNGAGAGLPLQMSVTAVEIGPRPALCVLLSDRSEHVLKQLQLASSVYESSSEAMIVTDEHNLILSVNPAFTKITGYAPDEVIGRAPSLLGSGRQEPAFYRDMWDALNARGNWCGEIWNRRKDGEVYVEWLTINVIASHGAPYRYVALFSDITEKKKTEKLVWTQANFDALTQLPNRRLFADRLAQGIKRATRAGTSLALLLIDLDFFKEVNDTYGHLVGDDLLVDAAARITACLRESDTVARLGGDEFAVILPDIADSQHVAGVARALLATLARKYTLGEIGANLSASIGVAFYPADSRDPVTLLKNADQAMYQSKEEGRNRFCYFSTALEERSARRAHLIRDLHTALPEQAFELYFQPVVDLRSGRLVKAEALLRWHHPRRGTVLPAEFIGVLEETGLIVEVGDWVFGEALRCGRRWSDLLGHPFRVGVNVSPVQLACGLDPGRWQRQMEAAGVAGDGVMIEITEGVLLMDKPHVRAALGALRAAGVELSLDDFGTGYSSLSYLNQFDLDCLKIDQSFIHNLTPGSRDLALSKAIIVMAHELGMRVVGEGIETAAQLELLRGAGCDYGQGYWFSKPLPAAQFEILLAGQGAPSAHSIQCPDEL
jgi:diguanylate cyclase (GGDEF)-like protein/PAS domain S-box-containing protein